MVLLFLTPTPLTTTSSSSSGQHEAIGVCLGGVEHVQDVVLPHNINLRLLGLKQLKLCSYGIEVVVVSEEADVREEIGHESEKGLHPVSDVDGVQQAELTDLSSDGGEDVVPGQLYPAVLTVRLSLGETASRVVFLYF